MRGTSGTVDHGIHGLGARGAVAAFAAALFVAFTSVTTAAAEPAPQAACHELIIFDPESGDVVEQLVRGREYGLYLIVVHAGRPVDCAGGDFAFLDDIDDVSMLRVELESGGLDVRWSQLAAEVLDNDTREFGFTRYDDTDGDFRWVWVIDEEVISTTGDFLDMFVDFNEDGPIGDPVGFTTLFFFTVDADASLGNYSLGSTVLEGGSALAFFVVDFRVIAAPIAAPAPVPTTLSCDGPPSVGVTVTCTVTADPSIDIVWSARTNPVFADGVVTTGPDGKGTFSFVVPAAALGQEVLVEMVGWLASQPIGTAGGPVPARIPAGDGQPISTGTYALAVGLAALIGAGTVTRRRVESAMR